ncbi:MAG TPA: hypothetical protein VNZ58_11040 [Thermomicrobiales bacterium]|nr:hypothetical protein [Thermomicrobiales bacterium]
MFVGRTPTPWRLLAALLVMSGLTLTSFNGAVAQQEPDPSVPLHVGITGEPLADIPADSLSAVAFDEGYNTQIGSCLILTSVTPGGCEIDAPVNSTILVELNTDSLPEGVMVVENPISFTTGEEQDGIDGVTFELAYAGDPAPTYTMQIMPTGDAIGDLPDMTVGVLVLSEDQSIEYGYCTLSMATKPAGCSVDVPASATVVAELDESTLPAGISVTENPVIYTTPAEKTQLGDIWFEFVYTDDGETPDVPESPAEPQDPGDVSGLPSTGTGAQSASASLGNATIVLASGVMAAILGAGAFLMRVVRSR